MTTFAYTARDEHGQALSGMIAASDASDASRQLRADGKYPVRIEPSTGRDVAAASASLPASHLASAVAAGGGIRIRRADLLQFSQQLSVMLDTGVTLPDALDCIAQQALHPTLAALVEDVARQVKSGTDFSVAIARHPRSFPRLYIALVRASEKSGMMPRLLARATVYLRDENDTRRRVKGALTYPAIMLGFATTVTLFLLAFVLPRFTGLYATKQAALPMPTKVLMVVSDFLTTNWTLLVPAAIGVVVAIVLHLRTPRGQAHRDWLQLHVPLLGSLFRQLHLARGLRMMGTMSGAGVALVDCVEVTHDLCDNTYFRRLWVDVSRQIQAGRQISEPLAASPLVPPAVAQMLRAGEKGGRLAQVMEQVATFSEAELKERITDLTRYIEPAMIVVMGLIIGGIALALLLPIFTISKVMAQ